MRLNIRNILRKCQKGSDRLVYRLISRNISSISPKPSIQALLFLPRVSRQTLLRLKLSNDRRCLVQSPEYSCSQVFITSISALSRSIAEQLGPLIYLLRRIYYSSGVRNANICLIGLRKRLYQLQYYTTTSQKEIPRSRQTP